MEETILNEINQNISKNNTLMEKMMQTIEENSICKEKLDKELKDKFFNNFIHVIDRMLDNQNDEELDSEFKLDDLYEDLNDFLEDNNLSYYKPNKNDSFDRTIHKVVKKVETTNPELNLKIENAITYGYKLEEVVIKPAKVTVYKFEGEK